jgi:hypothetical protein
MGWRSIRGRGAAGNWRKVLPDFGGIRREEGLHAYLWLGDAPEGRFARKVAILAAFLAGTFQGFDVWRSIVNYTSRNAAPGLTRDGVLVGKVGLKLLRDSVHTLARCVL